MNTMTHQQIKNCIDAGIASATTYAEKLFEYFYLSVVTFASIGYGDLVPVTVPARLLVILEIGQSFVMVVFGLSNINNINTTIKN